MTSPRIGRYAVPSSHEEINRRKKAFAIVRQLKAHGITAGQARAFTPAQWAAAAKAAGKNPPSDETVALILEVLGLPEHPVVAEMRAIDAGRV